MKSGARKSHESHLIKSGLFFDKVAGGYKRHVQVVPLLFHENTKA
jgi:hypothetical protein